MTLDPFTLITTLAVMHFLATAILIFVWHVNRSIPGVGFWALGRVCLTLALVAFALRPVTPLVPSVLTATGLLIAGLHFVWQGNLAFMKRSSPRLVIVVGLYGVVLMGMVYWSSVELNFMARTVLSAMIFITFDWLFVRALWPREGDEVYFFGKLMALAFVLSGCAQIVRAVVALSGGSGHTLLEPAAATQMGLMTAIVMSLISAMAYMAIIMEFLKKDLVRQAERDPLTGVFNRRAFHAVGNHILARSRRDGRAVSLLILDLDHFKSVNDTHGHWAGDTVLRRVVDLVQGVLRAQDVLVRLGGEEFAMMLPATVQSEALHVAERIRKVIEAELFEIGAGAIRVTTSLGVTSISTMSDNHEIDDLIKRADIALYQAKDEGRNRVCVSP